MEVELTNCNCLVFFWEVFVKIEYHSAYCQIFIRCRKTDTEQFVGFFYFQSGRNEVLIVTCLFRYIFKCIMFVFNITEYFFYKVFQWNNATGSSKFVGNNCQRLLLLQENLHHLLCPHAFGHYGYFTDEFLPIGLCRLAEHVRGVYVPNDMVQVFFVDDDFWFSAFSKAV